MKRDPYRAFLASLLLGMAVGCGDDKDGAPDPVVTSEGQGCVGVSALAETCPDVKDVSLSDLDGACGSTITEASGVGTWYQGDTAFFGTMCCYTVQQTEPTCVYGRPWFEGDETKVAETRGSRAWCVDVRASDCASIPDAAREELAAAWTEAALDEHAAVAAFSRVSLELLALGAPPELLRATHEAALDEIRHAQLGFGLASAYAGRAIGPAAFPLGDSVPLRRTLREVAAAAVREGCIGETLTTLVATEALARTTDPAAHAVLAAIVADEERHAQLAWRTVAWAIRVGGPDVRAAVAEHFADLERDGMAPPQRIARGPHAAILVAHGVPDEAAVARALSRGIRDVVLPAARALFAQEGTVREDRPRA